MSTAHSEHDARRRAGALPPDGDLRVILVGRTGLDAAMRLDPGIELIRTPSAIDAIGELGDPIDASTPARTTVVVGADADPGDEADEFIRALRSIDPDVAVARAGCDGEDRGVYDACIDAGAPTAALRLAVRTLHARRPGEAPAHVPHIAPSPADEPEAPRPSAATSPADEEGEDDETPLINALLTGRDLLLPALQSLRRRSGADDLVFIEDAAEGEHTVAPADVHRAGTQRVPVAHRSRRFGWLASAQLTADRLARHADRLAHWLALRLQQSELREAAFSDELTGACNRRYFERFLSAAIDRARADRHHVTLLYFDIDDFKQYNDRYGHGAGDEILRETVRLLKSVIRPTDKVCRIGGDEFAVVFYDAPGADRGPGRDPHSRPPASIREIARRFQRQICEHRFPKLGEQAPGTLTISGGLATFPWDGGTLDELLHRADELAIQSKRQGKNAITLGPGAERVCGG